MSFYHTWGRKKVTHIYWIINVLILLFYVHTGYCTLFQSFSELRCFCDNSQNAYRFSHQLDQLYMKPPYNVKIPSNHCLHMPDSLRAEDIWNHNKLIYLLAEFGDCCKMGMARVQEYFTQVKVKCVCVKMYSDKSKKDVSCILLKVQYTLALPSCELHHRALAKPTIHLLSIDGHLQPLHKIDYQL